MDAQAIIDWFVSVLNANIKQIGIFIGGVIMTALAAYFTRQNSIDTNQLGRERLEFEKDSKISEKENSARKQEREDEIQQSRQMFERQEALFDNTQKLVAILETRLERQTREAHEERQALKGEITGLKRQVQRLERRVAQLISALYRSGNEPPPEDIESEIPTNEK